MLDIRLIRKDRKAVESKLQKKEPGIDLETIFDKDIQVRDLKTRVELLKSKRNDVSKEIGELKRKGESATHLLENMATSADEIHQLDALVKKTEEELMDELSRLPNIPMDKVKISQDPKDNELIKEYKSKKNFTFPFKNHMELNEGLELFDFKRGAKLAGNGWPVYKGLGARLEWALLNYMLSIHIKNGFMQWIPPIVVRKDVMYGSGQLPKFANQQFKIEDADFHLYMIPTAEIPLNGLHIDEVLPEEELPLKYVAYTPCFRREAGAAGSNERGLIRTHQFNKVEMFCYAKPEESQKMFQEMLDSAEEILQGLDLHYRNMLLVTGDMSFAAACTVDIEVWLPGQNRYYEVSSVSNCTDFQSRRSNIRYRGAEGLEFVHTLNGSGLATSRLMVAILENNQNEDGSVTIPKVLRPYLDGLETIVPHRKI